jgi:hypothetical protein
MAAAAAAVGLGSATFRGPFLDSRWSKTDDHGSKTDHHWFRKS